MLSLLLFAGALHVDLSELKAYRLPVGALALLGTLLSTLVVGFAMWFVLPLIGPGLPLVYCLLFGALISPNDPIAVMGIFASAGAPKEPELMVAGLIIGNHGRALAMSDSTRRYLDMFWELIGEILNATLFVLIGMEVLLVTFSLNELVAAAVAISVTQIARLLTVGLPARFLQRAINLPRGSWKVLTWGGLRGGISVALALSRPPAPERDTVVALTYGVRRIFDPGSGAFHRARHAQVGHALSFTTANIDCAIVAEAMLTEAMVTETVVAKTVVAETILESPEGAGNAADA